MALLKQVNTVVLFSPGQALLLRCSLKLFKKGHPGCGTASLDLLYGGVLCVALLLLLFVQDVEDSHLVIDLEGINLACEANFFTAPVLVTAIL